MIWWCWKLHPPLLLLSLLYGLVILLWLIDESLFNLYPTRNLVNHFSILHNNDLAKVNGTIRVELLILHLLCIHTYIHIYMFISIIYIHVHTYIYKYFAQFCFALLLLYSSISRKRFNLFRLIFLLAFLVLLWQLPI